MMRILDLLFPPRSDETAVRSVSGEDFLALLAPRLVPETRPATVVLLPFSDQRVRSAIHEAKYHGTGRAVELLASALADYLRDADDFKLAKSVIVPVPLGKGRQKERGFNQVEEVAKCAVRGLGIKIDNALLIRTRETTSQVSLPRQRREENMRGAFGATRRADPSLTYIVIDDVITTGATLGAAMDALQAAGASHIIPLALAH